MDIRLLDCRGREWHLAGENEGAEGVTLAELGGLSGSFPDLEDGRGRFDAAARHVGRLDSFNPKLSVWVEKTEGLTAASVARRLLAGLDFFKPSKLVVSGARMPELALFVHLSKPVDLPDKLNKNQFALELELVAHDGCWFGAEHRATGFATIENTGDVPLWPVVRWHGLAASIAEDRNGTILLPPALGVSGLTYYTDPATGGLVTDNQGYPNHKAWATMRGIAWTRPVMPGDGTTVDCTFCEIVWRNRYLAPWSQTGGIISNAGTSNNQYGREWAAATGRPYAFRLFD
ncbi:hypothetical protein [Corynebacterium amycolatum]|uniref:hypothetical protein n=1 Tax=Corynebacterium amycolatum TaxID=43765 RepID=UPI00191F367F|nr:hypothetical protein [Corynebacterium amycolatum]QQU97776.1 hypothetical protein I6I65_10665 [Corynebacterium amycolatum]